MNSKVAKTLRRFAELEKLNYNYVKSHFQTRGKEEQQAHLKLMRERIKQAKGGEK